MQKRAGSSSRTSVHTTIGQKALKGAGLQIQPEARLCRWRRQRARRRGITRGDLCQRSNSAIVDCVRGFDCSSIVRPVCSVAMLAAAHAGSWWSPLCSGSSIVYSQHRFQVTKTTDQCVLAWTWARKATELTRSVLL